MPETSVERSSRAAFRYPNFRYYLLARLLTTISSEMQSVAVGWQVYAITHRPLDLGLMGLAQFLPGVCLFLAAGHIADRVARQRILQTCLVGFSICSSLLLLFTLNRAAFGHVSVYPIYAVMLLNGTVRAFNAPASQAFLPLLVPREVFPNAVAWTSSVFQTAAIAGPMLGGILYGVTGSPVMVYLLAGVAYLGGFFLISGLRLVVHERPKTAASLGIVLNGLKYIWANKLVLGAISLDLFAVLLGGAVALLPVYAREILGVGATGLGVLRSAPGVGAVLTSLAIAHWPLKRRAGLAMLWCVFGFGVFTIAFGLSRSLAFSLIMLLLIGASDIISVIVRSTMIQLGTPDAMRGRVSAVNMVFVGASNEVGQFESGLTAQWFGAVPAVVLGGIGTILIVAAWACLFPSLRSLDRLVADKGASVEE
ncbi:MAG TPA: MFS transporter [Bryobacteraceae bacterium]